MNTLQRDIYSVILSIIKIDDFDRMYKDHTIRYGLLNYIAKYSLARDSYFATETSLNYLGKWVHSKWKVAKRPEISEKWIYLRTPSAMQCYRRRNSKKQKQY